MDEESALYNIAVEITAWIGYTTRVLAFKVVGVVLLCNWTRDINDLDNFMLTMFHYTGLEPSSITSVLI